MILQKEIYCHEDQNHTRRPVPEFSYARRLLCQKVSLSSRSFFHDFLKSKSIVQNTVQYIQYCKMLMNPKWMVKIVQRVCDWQTSKSIMYIPFSHQGYFTLYRSIRTISTFVIITRCTDVFINIWVKTKLEKMRLPWWMQKKINK